MLALAKIARMGMSARLRVSAAVAASYVLAFAPLLLLGPMGVWWASVMLPMSLPLAFIACAISLCFAASVVQRPAAWNLGAVIAAVALSVVGLRLVSGSWIGVVSVIVAVPAAAIFYLLVRAWLRPKLASARRPPRVASRRKRAAGNGPSPRGESTHCGRFAAGIRRC